MFQRIFPKQIDNHFPGHWLAQVIFALLILARGAMGFNSILLTHDVVTKADGIPLDSYGAPAAAAVLLLFKITGLLIVLLALLGLLALIRYRAMIPLLYLVQIIQIGGSKWLAMAYPVTRSSAIAMGVPIVQIMIALALLGFVLCLIKRRTP